ncbi:MAG: RAD55 family ATPase [Melioribacteraceae bacterium]|nr:RAD55 family ATPase [Melioribacteraceae bacterium]
MSGAIRLIPSGFSLIDKNWGGIYRGGSYVVLGPRKSGRTLLGLQFALEAAKGAEVCVFFTLMRPKDLMIQAASINFDIQSYMNQNLIIVVRIAPPTDIDDLYNPDDYLVEYLNDIITVVNQYHPTRIIFDELTPFIGFRNLDYLKDAFLHTLETIEEKDITSLFVIGEPATQRAQSIVDIVTNYVTAVIQLKKTDKSEDRYHGGQVVITPNVGHTEGRFTTTYQIVPNKGVTVELVPELRETSDYTFTPINQRRFDQTKIDLPSEPYAFSNIYNYNDFLLILNNQIALYKSTGQTFNLVSFKLDHSAQMKGLVTIQQLQNAVRLSTNKKDKICLIENKVIVLLVRGNTKSVMDLTVSFQNNLPNQDIRYINTVSELISIFNLEVDDKVENAENMMDLIITAENSASENYLPLSRYNS